MKEFESAKDIFENMDTQYKMQKYFTEKFSLLNHVKFSWVIGLILQDKMV